MSALNLFGCILCGFDALFFGVDLSLAEFLSTLGFCKFLVGCNLCFNFRHDQAKPF